MLHHCCIIVKSDDDQRRSPCNSHNRSLGQSFYYIIIASLLYLTMIREGAPVTLITEALVKATDISVDVCLQYQASNWEP